MGVVGGGTGGWAGGCRRWRLEGCGGLRLGGGGGWSVGLLRCWVGGLGGGCVGVVGEELGYEVGVHGFC